MTDFNLFTQALLPVALALMMFVLGLNVRLSDFKKITLHPKAFLIGVSLQLVLLPVLAWGIITIANSVTHVPALVSMGLILLALCPGGATSNAISQLSGGNPALSVSMTFVVSLVVPFILPALFVLQVKWLGQQIHEFDVPLLQTTVKLFIISVIPVFLGMLVTKFARQITVRHKKAAKVFSTWLFVLVVCLLIANNVSELVDVGLLAAVLCLALCISAILVTFYITNKAKLNQFEIKTLQIEVGIQNAAMGIFVAVELLNWSELALIPLCYGILMNIPALFFIFSHKYSKNCAQNER